jgi:hypothetical protein
VRCTRPQREQLTGGPRVPCVSHRNRGEELRRAGAHRRQPLSANRVFLRVLRLKANPMSSYARPETDWSELAASHGETVALLTVDPWRWFGRARLEGFRSSAVQRRTKRARKEVEKSTVTRWPHAQRRRSRRRRRRGRAGSYRALPDAWRCVPQRRSESGAPGRRNQRMARLSRKNGRSGA